MALPTIFAGINQTIMMALAMVIIASRLVKGLGQPVLQSIYNQYFTKGVLYGLAIVIVVIVLTVFHSLMDKESRNTAQGRWFKKCPKQN